MTDEALSYGTADDSGLMMIQNDDPNLGRHWTIDDAAEPGAESMTERTMADTRTLPPVYDVGRCVHVCFE